ncbi:MAG: glycosyltransferase family 4 protein [Chloroflexi bacterium]|nr:glycosyltransferase family 4 protein [Chloroflexota bacterium]
MRVALVSPYDFAYPGGVTTHVSRLDEELTLRGHYVRILAPSSRSAAALGHPRLAVLGKPFPWPSNGSIARITMSWGLLPRIRRLLQEECFDIIHLHEPFCPFLPTDVLRLSQSINVGTFHAFYTSSKAYALGRWLLRPYGRKLHARTAVSVPARDFVARYFPGEYNLIPNGIDVEGFTPWGPGLPELLDGMWNILFVGRLEKRKGAHLLLRAFSHIKAELPNSRLIILGPGKRGKSQLEGLLNELDLRDVVLAGMVPHEELPAYYRSAHVFCAPSLGQESFGMILLEAMASGVPIVASDIPGYASLLGREGRGVLVPRGNVDALARSVVDLLRDGDRRQEMARLGREYALGYSWPHITDQVESLYRALVGEATPALALV